jgi:hypothetical protein
MVTATFVLDDFSRIREITDGYQRFCAIREDDELWSAGSPTTKMEHWLKNIMP